MAMSLGFIVLSTVGVFLMSAMSWSRKVLAKHRERLRQAGYVENNVPWRLRQDMYLRVFFVAYMVSGVLLLWVLPSPAPHMRHVPFILQLGAVLSAAGVAFIVGGVVWKIVRTVVEFAHPIGEVALKMRDLQFHPQIQRVQPAGEHGTAREVSPDEAGLIDQLNFQGRQMKGYVPIVSDNKKGQKEGAR